MALLAFDVRRLAAGVVEADRALGRAAVMSGNLSPNCLRRAGPEVVVEEVGDVRIVGAPTEDVDAVELAGVGVVDERAGLLDLDRGIDAEVVLELGLEVLGDDVLVVHVAARDVAVLDLGLEPVREAGLGQQGLGGRRVEVVPRVAGAAVRDGARREVGGDLRARRPRSCRAGAAGRCPWRSPGGPSGCRTARTCC